MNINTKKKNSGFTLVELMVAIGIFSILLTIAIPNFLTWQSSYRFKKAVQELYHGFQLARMVAMKEHVLCTIVFHQPVDGVTYDYVIFAENISTVEQDLEYDAGERILVKVKLSDYQNVIFDTEKGEGDGLTFFNNDDDKPAIAFRPTGFSRNNSGGFGAGTAFLKNTKNGVTKSVVIAPGGRTRID